MKKSIILFLLVSTALFGLHDLEQLSQDFVLETKQIQIPNYPFSFNPSIIRWQGQLLMSFRARDPLTGSTNQMGFAWLDEGFNLISDPQIIDIQFRSPLFPSRAQDPRLIEIANRLYIVFNNVREFIGGEIRRMYIAELNFDGNRFAVLHPVCINQFDGEKEDKTEKNWVPFDYQGDLMLAYSINPHRIFYPVLESGACELLHETFALMRWDWGILRGGTPALAIENEYLAFFHTNKAMATVQSDGVMINHYFMGAYTFSKEPPFALRRLSPQPIFGKGFYTGPCYDTWKPLRVVFPMGYVMDENYFWIAYGKQDHEIWIAKLDRKKLLKSLVPVTPIH